MKKLSIVIFFIFSIVVSLFLLRKSFKLNLDLRCADCNLIIISLTNTRKDHLGIYGYHRNTTANIDNFFKESLIFNNAFAPTSWTLPNAVSMFTSSYPDDHGVVNRYNANSIPIRYSTLAEILKNDNYKTAAFTGGGDYNRIYGFDRGFDDYYDSKNFSGISENKEIIIDWLNGNKKEKFFLFLQGFDTHCPFNPPYPYNEKYDTAKSDLDNSVCYWNLEGDQEKNSNKDEYAVYRADTNEDQSKHIFIAENDKEKLIDMYDGSIKKADDALGEIFEVIRDSNLDKNTIIILLSEHGDLIGDNGRFMRTDILGTFTDEVLNIPLIVKNPKYDKVKNINGLVNLIDVMPTIFDLLGINYNKENIGGKSIMPLFASDQESEVNDYVYGWMKQVGSQDNLFFKDIREIKMIRDYKNKLIIERRYDLDSGNLNEEKIKFYSVGDGTEYLLNSSKEDGYIKDRYDKMLNLLIK